MALRPPLSPVRRRFLEFAGAIVVVHALAIAAYYGFDIPGRGERAQRMYAWGWMGVTVALVLVGLQRIKRARRQGAGSSARQS